MGDEARASEEVEASGRDGCARRGAPGECVSVGKEEELEIVK